MSTAPLTGAQRGMLGDIAEQMIKAPAEIQPVDTSRFGRPMHDRDTQALMVECLAAHVTRLTAGERTVVAGHRAFFGSHVGMHLYCVVLPTDQAQAPLRPEYQPDAVLYYIGWSWDGITHIAAPATQEQVARYRELPPGSVLPWTQ